MDSSSCKLADVSRRRQSRNRTHASFRPDDSRDEAGSTLRQAPSAGGGNGEAEPAALARRAPDVDRSAVRLDDAPNDWQPEPAAVVRAAALVPEAVEYVWQVLDRD